MQTYKALGHKQAQQVSATTCYLVVESLLGELLHCCAPASRMYLTVLAKVIHFLPTVRAVLQVFGSMIRQCVRCPPPADHQPVTATCMPGIGLAWRREAVPLPLPAAQG